MVLSWFFTVFLNTARHRGSDPRGLSDVCRAFDGIGCVRESAGLDQQGRHCQVADRGHPPKRRGSQSQYDSFPFHLHLVSVLKVHLFYCSPHDLFLSFRIKIKIFSQRSWSCATESGSVCLGQCHSQFERLYHAVVVWCELPVSLVGSCHYSGIFFIISCMTFITFIFPALINIVTYIFRILDSILASAFFLSPIPVCQRSEKSHCQYVHCL